MNDVYLFDVFCCDGSVKGGELFEFIETEGRVDEDVTVRLLRQVLEGVEFLHSHNILHMDIKVFVCVIFFCFSFSLRIRLFVCLLVTSHKNY